MTELKSSNIKLAIIIGNSNYDNYSQLTACDNDLFYINEILKLSKEFNEILEIKNQNSGTANEKIIDFIEKYKNKTIDQVLFYFTGHGYRNSDDFYFCLKNTSIKNLRTTSLSNTDIDNYLKSLKPKVAIKIIDACYSGEQYIKDTNDNNFLKLSQSNLENTFNEIYFMYSSKSDEMSEATEEISAFTEIFLESIIKLNDSNKIQYKYIMDYLRDNAIERLNHTPYFVTQGTNLAYMFKDIQPIQSFLKGHLEKESLQINDKPKQLNLLELIRKESSKYCNESEGIEGINKVFSTLENYKFRTEINEIFDTECSYSKNIKYNSKFIGEWLNNSKENNILAKVTFHDVTVSEKAYVKQPKRPNKFFTLSNIFGEDEYKIEDVQVHKKVVAGIQYLVQHDKLFLQLTFKAKSDFQSVQNYVGCFTILFNKKTIFFFYCFEKLSISSWNNYDPPKCLNWKLQSFLLKEPNIQILETVMKNLENFILEDIKISLNLKYEDKL